MELGPIFRAMMRHRARFLLIALEVALTLAIVANSVSLILDARAEMTRPSGFDEENLIHVVSTPFAEELKDPQRLRQLLDEDLRTLRTLPGVVGVTHTSLMPWGFNTMTMAVRLAGTQDEAATTQFVLADEGFAEALGIGFSQGQNFTRETVEAASQNPQGIDTYEGDILLTQVLADAVFPQGNAVGQILELPEAPGRYRVV